MNAASILLALVAAGQAGWTPERGAAPPPASAAEYDRYAQPAAPRYAPPPGVADRTRTAMEQSGTAIREGLESGFQAANERLQGWADDANRQLQATGGNLRAAAEQALGAGGSAPPQIANPFGTRSSSATSSQPTRGGVTPPPWNTAGATGDADWDLEPSTADSPAGLEPLRTSDGWTSIGSSVAAPPMPVPQLTISTPDRSSTARDGWADSGPQLSMPALGNEPIHSLLGDTAGQRTPPPQAADNWATGWGDAASAPRATISRAGSGTSSSATNAPSATSAQTANSASPSSPQPASGNWADLWGGEDPWADPNQAPVASPTQQSASAAAAPPSLPSGSVAAATSAGPSLGAPHSQHAAPNMAARPATSGEAKQDEPPWVPLLVVSVSLAGSLGANLFLGWSYLDARQKYQALVRKTAEKFRLAVSAAA